MRAPQCRPITHPSYVDWGFAMSIYRLLQGRAFGPDEITILSKPFEAALRELKL